MTKLLDKLFSGGSKSSVFVFLIAANVIIVIAGGAIIAGNARQQELNSLKRQAAASELTLAQNAGKALQSSIGDAKDELALAADSSEIEGNDRAACQSKLQELRRILSKFGNLARVDKQGVFSCALNQSIVGRRADSFSSFQSQIFTDPSHPPVLSRAVALPDSSGGLVVGLHVPVTDVKGQFNGTLAGAISLQSLQSQYLADIKLSPHAYIVLIDDNQEILYHPDSQLIGQSFDSAQNQQNLGSSYGALGSILKTALAGSSQTIQYKSNNEDRQAAFYPFNILGNRRWVIAVIQPTADIVNGQDASARNILLGALLSFAFLVAAIGAVTIAFVLFSILQPIKQVANIASGIGAGDLGQRVPYEGPDEIGRLGRAFNQMANRLQDYYGGLETKVQEKTAELQTALRQAEEQNKSLEDVKKATLNILEDLSEEKAAADKARERVEQERIRDEALINSLGEGLIVMDERGNVTEMNPPAAELLGVKAKDIVGQWFPRAVPIYSDEKGSKVDDFERPVAQAMTTGKPVITNEFYYRHKDGHYFPVSMTVSPFLLDDKPVGAVEVFHDITKEKELEKAKEEFVSLASHQLRTPATGVKAFLSMLHDGYAGKLSAKQMEFLDKAFDSNERQLRIVDDMLNVARADSGRLVLAKTEFDLSKLIDDVVVEQQPVIETRRQSIDIKKPATLKTLADADRMRMVLENLLSNASKYTPEGGKLGIIATTIDDDIEFSVHDSGVGIDKKDFEKLYQKFARFNNELSAKVGGTGLGLYLVKKIVDLHGGTITVDSALGKGTTFTVRYPRANPAQAVAEAADELDETKEPEAALGKA